VYSKDLEPSTVMDVSTWPYVQKLNEMYILPPMHQSSMDSALQQKISDTIKKKEVGIHFNESLRSSKNFNNPYILTKIADLYNIIQTGSCYPKHLYDSSTFLPSDFYLDLTSEQCKEEERLLIEQRQQEMQEAQQQQLQLTLNNAAKSVTQSHGQTHQTSISQQMLIKQQSLQSQQHILQQQQQQQQTLQHLQLQNFQLPQIQQHIPSFQHRAPPVNSSLSAIAASSSVRSSSLAIVSDLFKVSNMHTSSLPTVSSQISNSNSTSSSLNASSSSSSSSLSISDDLNRPKKKSRWDQPK
jgi:hypothetical protein